MAIIENIKYGAEKRNGVMSGGRAAESGHGINGASGDEE